MFERTLKILNANDFLKIQRAHILLVGLGGVGGMALECLVRLGFLNITIVDGDTFEESNLNRQILCLKSTLNQDKVKVAEKRALDINPQVKITPIKQFLTKDNLDDLFKQDYDYIIDACDTITIKVLLIKKASEKHIKIISSMGTGNRLNPGDVMLTTLNKTQNDPVAKVMRGILKKEGLPLNIPVVWSRELPLKKHNSTPDSLVLVPNCAGINLAYYVLNDILNSK